MHCAAYNGNVAIMKYFLSKGENINQPSHTGATSLQFSLYVENPKLEMVKLLIDNGANVKAADEKKWQTLHSSANLGIPNTILKYLIDSGSDVNAIDYRGRSPLTIAIDYNKVETAKFLLANGAKANVKVSGKSALRKSFEKNFHDLTALIMESLRKELKPKVFASDCQDCSEFMKKCKICSLKSECPVCAEQKIGTFAFVPCGHAQTCLACTNILIDTSYNPKCPFCRESIDNYITVFS